MGLARRVHLVLLERRVKAGFRLVKEEPHRSFGRKLTGEYWELKL